jgi:hypothetical protein
MQVLQVAQDVKPDLNVLNLQQDKVAALALFVLLEASMKSHALLDTLA